MIARVTGDLEIAELAATALADGLDVLNRQPRRRSRRNVFRSLDAAITAQTPIALDEFAALLRRFFPQFVSLFSGLGHLAQPGGATRKRAPAEERATSRVLGEAFARA